MYQNLIFFNKQNVTNNDNSLKANSKKISLNQYKKQEK